MQILPIAASALSSASTSTAIRAHNIANVSTPNYTAKEPVYSSVVNGGVAVFAQDVKQPTNLVLNVVGLKSSLEQYKAAASLISRADEMNQALIDSVA